MEIGREVLNVKKKLSCAIHSNLLTICEVKKLFKNNHFL